MEDIELGVQILTNIHDRGDVTAAVAVIWCRPNRDNRLLWEVVLSREFSNRLGAVFLLGATYLVALIDQLMGTRNELQAIDMIEFACDFVSEKPAGTARRNGPGVYIFRITPYQITESTFVGDLLGSGYYADLINRSDLGTQSTVNAEDLAVNNSSKNQKIEDLAA